MKKYRHSELVWNLAKTLKQFFNCKQVSSVHPTADGSCVVFKDTQNDQVYLLEIRPIKSEVKTGDITIDKLIKDGGFHDGK